MTLNGIPLHPLVVHAAVVLVPLTALFAVGFAFVPRRRWQLRTVGAAVAVASAVCVQLAVMTGDDLKERLNEDTSIIEDHEHWAGLLQVTSWILAALMVLAWWALPHDNPLPDRGEHAGVAALTVPLVVLLTIGAVALCVLVVLTGDTGAKSVWGDAAGDTLASHPVPAD